MKSRDLINHPFTLKDFEVAKTYLYQTLQATAQIEWPLLSARAGCEVWVKHENHLPTGAFKVRGGLWYMSQLISPPANSVTNKIKGVIAATRGNHGQSVALAAKRNALEVVIVVPHGNNPHKNKSIRALGAELIEHGQDFNEALDHARFLASERGLHAMPSFHSALVQGVGTGSLEFLQNAPPLDTVYVPIGIGSSICAMIAVRNALGLETEIVGVVAEKADAYALSFERGEIVTTTSADTLAGGLAVRIPDPHAFAYMQKNIPRVVRVSEQAMLDAIRHYFTDTHNLAEGAGASALAALLSERGAMRGKRVGIVLTGGNADEVLLKRALA